MTTRTVAMPRISFYVQHLLGIGHLARAFRIARALVAADWDVDVVIGGELPPGFDADGVPMTLLPPVRAAAGGLSSLVHPDGRPFDEAAKAHRCDRLLAHVASRRPDVLLIEAFPFGRRQMRFELLPLLDMVGGWAAKPLVVASVRDILQANRRPERTAETLDLLDRFFDRVLVHGDPSLVRLEESFPAAAGFADKLLYTGLVAPPPKAPPGDAPFDVVVSVGGGAVGRALLDAATAARSLSSAAKGRWLVLTGPNLPPGSLHDRSGEVEGLTVRSFVPDLAGVLAGARLSISQAGYNTVADILVAGCRAVLVPYAQDGETEQSLRAARLAARDRAAVVSETDLGPASLARAIDRALASPTSPLFLRLDGAGRTAALLDTLLSENDAGLLSAEGAEQARWRSHRGVGPIL